MRILKLKLRGAIGIKKGLGVDEIEIEFEKFHSGLIALTGRNGSGKTTVMENLHPYRQMVSRDGSLQAHFFLKDSYRVLIFQVGDCFYKSQILIDALTGASEAYLFQYLDDPLGGDNISCEPLNDGKLTTYDTEIEKLLGTPELFFNSVFSGQKSKGIAELKSADRRKLFYELLNLNSYETYLEKAKAELKKKEIKLAELEGEIKALNGGLGKDASLSLDYKGLISNLEHKRDGFAEDIEELMHSIGQLDNEIEELNEVIKEYEIDIRTKESKLTENSEIEKNISSINDSIKTETGSHNSKILRYNSEIEDCTKLIERNKNLASRKEEIDSMITRRDEAKEQISSLQQEKNSLQTRMNKIQENYSADLQALNAQEKNINNLRNELQKLDSQADQHHKNLERMKKDIAIIDQVPCGDKDSIISKYDFSGCQFLQNAYKTKIEFTELSKDNIDYGARLVELESIIKRAEDIYEHDKNMYVEKFTVAMNELKDELAKVDKNIFSADALLKEIGKKDIDKMQKDSLEAENNIKLLEGKIDSTKLLIKQAVENFDLFLSRNQTSLKELNLKLDNELPMKISELKESLSKNRLDLGNKNSLKNLKRERYDETRAEIAEIEHKIEMVQKDAERMAALNELESQVESEICDWTFLCKAFDKTGIPVLKLENSGIEITSIANELLSLFENKFRIVFETTSLTKDKKKLKETFDINVVEEDGVCEIGNKSGGQQVWLETAIQLSIMILLSQQGKKSETAFLDEKDGALDLDNAYAYIEMIKKAHQMSGVYNTFVITHRTELLDFIPQQVKLNNGILEVVS
ncbi:MAG: hypothetical protein HYS25_13665 [Ignavibacteriales bacterium]|nr:hypothetical protein [Ignavibacteriales bacterium]